ncbi:flagellar basal-body rod protein FlgF [Oceanisphaera psychrotolerans]|uniref:Flagellar basal-body rod protein FlgF n=1 Tax=Oceanisphaera psychrotolerans TaxID=1414654 RepID=A0A1J4QCB5_9GAMM|nr:flagellar basal-body rod protein FlgF [Oceanisphaera psychrotolerans]OIN07728.1 flagellar basal-body rod protein FlgF [Oceanisphaera psychrotolerans]
MDHLLYIAMSGAKENMNSVALRANNLANANTTGFKADMEQARAMQAFGEGLPSRVFAMTERPGQSFAAGPLQTTGRELDVAVAGDGWLAVESKDGSEAYTRSGSLQVSPEGLLQTGNGLNVLDDNGGPIFLPLPLEKMEINKDGTIFARLEGEPANGGAELQRIKTVLPDNGDLDKGLDGLFRRKDGQAEPPSAQVQLIAGALEGSNVNPVAEMTHLIDLQRRFETQLKMMNHAEENDKAHAQLLRIG